MPLSFSPSPALTLGVELELQLLDPETLATTPASPRVFERLGKDPSIKPELFCSMVEIATGVCRDVSEVRRDLETALARLRGVCDELGVLVAGGGAHPFTRYRDRVPYPRERYEIVLDRDQWLARRLAIYGLHIHLGMRDGDHAIRMMNALLPYSPHLLALTAASPFWEGVDTGLASARVTVFESMPTAGVPPTFSRWNEFEQTYDALVHTESIRSIKDLWWDVRPQPELGTLELRICDTPHTIAEVLSIVALAHSLAVLLDEQAGIADPVLRPTSIWVRQNKWRVARHGLDARIVADGGATQSPVRDQIAALLKELRPVAARLGATRELEGLTGILARGAGYARQRAVWERDGDLRSVVRLLVDELAADRMLVDASTPSPAGRPGIGADTLGAVAQATLACLSWC